MCVRVCACVCVRVCVRPELYIFFIQGRGIRPDIYFIHGEGVRTDVYFIQGRGVIPDIYTSYRWRVSNMSGGGQI